MTVQDKLWFTFKARIQAHIRLAKNDFHSQALLVWYAIVSAALSIFAIRYPQILGPDTDILSAVMGVALLAISLFVTNQDFRGRAIAMRSNYLALQDLYDSIVITGQATKDDVDKYSALLASSENHKEIDDKRFRVFHNGQLTSRKPTCAEKIEVYLKIISTYTILICLYLWPFLTLLRKA